jgi:hypothetical protein
MEDQPDPVDNATNYLWQRRLFRHGDQDIVVAGLYPRARLETAQGLRAFIGGLPPHYIPVRGHSHLTTAA